MSLVVLIANATSVPNVETVGKSDPYAIVEFQGLSKKTEVKKSDLDPVWNESLTFDLKGKPLKVGDELKIYVKDWERIGRNRLLGTSVVQLKELTRRGASKTLQLCLTLKDGSGRETMCKLNLTVTYKAPPSANDGGGNKAVSDKGSEAGDHGGTVIDMPDEEGSEEEYYDDETGSTGEVSRKEKQKGHGKRKIRGQLSAKSQDFQIRIKVVEARQLPGSNISPVSRITCYNQTKQTRVQHSTNSPFWNEVFFFNYYISPAELFDEIITFSVYNSRKLRSDAFIGSFKCDIGMIYEENKHAILNKWLLLSDPDDTMAGAKGYLKISAIVLGPGDEAPTFKTIASDEDEDIESNLLRPAGVQLRPATFILKIYRAEDLPRMDSNIFEGIKKMISSEKKDLVDPYFVFSFAGKEVKSKIVYNCDHPEWNEELRLGLRFPSMCERIKLQLFDWDTIGEDDKIGTEWLCTAEISALGDPEFEEALYQKHAEEEVQRSKKEVRKSVRRHVSSTNLNENISAIPMADDSFDSLEPDTQVDSALEKVAESYYAPVKYDKTPSNTASFGAGFLPTFGPCYVNFYGSTREYSELPDEYDDLNMGKGEGVAFRGRALVELQTVLGEFPESASGEINPDDVLRVQKFMRRRKFKLHAAFLNATMISAIDAPVEFEISIGNYGNKLDESVPPCSSTTQPTNAVFDGSFYYFLPWGDTKPCCVVDCHWEDISFRLETLNFLIYVIDRLQINLDRMNMAMKANLSTPELAQIMIALLDQLIDDVAKPLPDQQRSHIPENNLDKQLRFYREIELEHICKEAQKLRENATDLEEALHEVENYMAQLNNMANEPQNSMPDVIIWMISGESRIAYYRCPAHLVLWSPNPEYRGKYCGKLETIELKYPGNKATREGKSEIPAMLRLRIWLGLEKNEKEWHTAQTEGELAVFAETYENQVSILGNWTNKGPTLSRPKWSDVTGKVKLDQDSFEPPPGWRWGGEWYISPELSMMYDKDSGHSQFLDDVYERQARYPGGQWGPDTVQWSDVKGDSTTSKDEIVCPEGWEWEHDWDIDYNRAVDEIGWEYCVEATLGGYGPVEKNYHLCRRRRWVRSRNLVKTTKKIAEEEKQLTKIAEGWEYAPLFNMKFHHKERKMDMVRRRRWHRKMVCDSPSSPCFFNIPESADEEDERYQSALTAPRMFLTCDKTYKYQLRSYMYQARDLLAGDSSGLSDPFARVVFLNQSTMSETIKNTVCPTWDQTLIFDSVNMHGDPKEVALRPPQIMIEVFDHDTFGSAEFLGRTRAFPTVKLDSSDSRTCVLQWYTIKKGDQYAGELLAAFELLLMPNVSQSVTGDVISSKMDGKDLPFLPPKKGKLYIVPSGIRPVLQRTAIEVMGWGVRNMKKFQLASVTSPSVEFEIGGHIQSSRVIKNTKRNPNFDEPVLFFDILLPKEELYTPPLNIKVKDNRQFGRKPLVGIHSIKSLEQFRCNPIDLDSEIEIELPALLGVDQEKTLGDTVIDMPDEKTPILDETSQTESKAAKKDKNLIRSKRKKKEAFVNLSFEFGIDDAKERMEIIKQSITEDNKAAKAAKDEENQIKEAVATKTNNYLKDITANSMVEQNDHPAVELIEPQQVGKKKKLSLKKRLKERLKQAKKAGNCLPAFMSTKYSQKNYKTVLKYLASQAADEDIDWWSKYYASIGETDKCRFYLEYGYDRLNVYDKELEKVEPFEGFTDFCHMFEFNRGKSIEEEESSVVGELKGTFRVYPLPDDPGENLPVRHLSNLPPSEPEDCIIRVYIIRAIDLQPNDPSGLADPYVCVILGKKKMSSKDTYVPNSLNPVFGRSFEIKATLPLDKDLLLQVKDYDLLSSDDVIGETSIDLENRYLSKYRATVGLQKTYCVSGPSEWRDSKKPKEILEDFLLRNNRPVPEYTGNHSVKIANRTYNLSDFELVKPTHTHLGSGDQRLALHLLHCLPAALENPLVKEHVETRPLYNPLQPGIEQGKLQLWVDIFPQSMGEPGPPVDVSARTAKKYQLRIIVWNTMDVILEEESITGEMMSDIYVKCWIAGIDDKHETDVHYRSLTGEGNFNWRLVFPFSYIPAEESIVVKKKEHFWSLDETELRMPPILLCQVWDNDLFSADDFLGTVELNMNRLPKPAKTSYKCKLSQLPDVSKQTDPPTINLFEARRVKGFWPVYNDETGDRVLTGKVEMEMELLTIDEAEQRPVGKGQSEPNQFPHLDPPKRPETSFLWFTSPLKTLKFVVWKNYKWIIISFFLILLAVLFLALFIYNVPGAAVTAAFSKLG